MRGLELARPPPTVLEHADAGAYGVAVAAQLLQGVETGGAGAGELGAQLRALPSHACRRAVGRSSAGEPGGVGIVGGEPTSGGHVGLARRHVDVEQALARASGYSSATTRAMQYDSNPGNTNGIVSTTSTCAWPGPNQPASGIASTIHSTPSLRM